MIYMLVCLFMICGVIGYFFCDLLCVMGSKQRKSRKRKRGFYGNQHNKKGKPSSENDSAETVNKESASCTKISSENIEFERNSITNNYGMYFDSDCLQNIISIMACPDCKSCGTIKVANNDQVRFGWAMTLTLSCDYCGFLSDGMRCSKKQGKAYEINRRLVYGMRQIGCGFSEAKSFLTY